MKQFLIFLLITSHVIINCVSASVHITEDYEHGHDVPHKHFSSALSHDNNFQHDDAQHDHDDGAHMHLEFQLSDVANFKLAPTATKKLSDFSGHFLSNILSPPVPPPTA